MRVRLQPRASRPGLAGWRDGVLIARVAAPPVDGRANEALCRLLCDVVGVARTRVNVVRGHNAREKVVRIEGVGDAQVRAALGDG